MVTKASEARRIAHNARMLAHHARRRGELISQPCEVCGALKVEAHHDDYSKPLEVRWLCRPHHNAVDPMARRGSRGSRALV